MGKLWSLLQEVDAELVASLEEKQLKPEFFAFRWITVLLSQEFALPDVIRLWDSLFAARDRQEYLIKVGGSFAISGVPPLLAVH